MLVGLLLNFSVLAHEEDQDPTGGFVQGNRNFDCFDSSFLKEVMIRGKHESIIIGNKDEKTLIMVYVNSETRLFYVIEHFTTRKSCIITHGHNFLIDVEIDKPVPEIEAQ
tara:strand:- start:588 stop:917 length:330 start_codon:yes stop_codon:yes gene_type:complete